MTHGIPKRGFQVHHAFRLVSMEGGEGIPGQGQVGDARFFFHLTHRSFFQALAWFELALGEVPFSIALNPKNVALVIPHHAPCGRELVVARTKGHPHVVQVVGVDLHLVHFRAALQHDGQVSKHAFGRVEQGHCALGSGPGGSRHFLGHRAKFHPAIQHEYIVAL